MDVAVLLLCVVVMKGETDAILMQKMRATLVVRRVVSFVPMYLFSTNLARPGPHYFVSLAICSIAWTIYLDS